MAADGAAEGNSSADATIRQDGVLGESEEALPAGDDESEESTPAGDDESEEAPPVAAGVDDAAQAVSALEGALVTAQTRPQFDALFKEGQALALHFQTDPALGPLERAAVEQHVRDIVKRARIDYDRNRARANSDLAVGVDRITLSLEALAEARTVTAVQDVRADLRLIRESLQAAAAWASRDAQARAWDLWQSANQAAWTAVNECWKANEQALTSLLDRAQADMERGNPRGAKMHIKEFHELAKTSQGSHAFMRTLRTRARQLWDEASAAARERHEAYVVIARRRLEYMRTLLGRAQQSRQRVESELTALEANVQRTQTDVAAALLRGQIEERRKELRRLTAETAGLQQRISEAEKALA